MKVSFYVQREIVSGLRYEQKTSRKGIQGKTRKQLMLEQALASIVLGVNYRVLSLIGWIRQCLQ